MNTRRTNARRVGEEIENVRATPQDNQVPAQVQASANDQVSINPAAMSDGEVRSALLSQDITTQTQAIMEQANIEVVPLENKHASTMASCLRDFTRMNPSIFLGSKVDEYPQDFLDEVYKILFAMGVSTIEKTDLASCQRKDSRALGGGP